jgi:hypothetical protein
MCRHAVSDAPCCNLRAKALHSQVCAVSI